MHSHCRARYYLLFFFSLFLYKQKVSKSQLAYRHAVLMVVTLLFTVSFLSIWLYTQFHFFFHCLFVIILWLSVAYNTVAANAVAPHNFVNFIRWIFIFYLCVSICVHIVFLKLDIRFIFVCVLAPLTLPST